MKNGKRGVQSLSEPVINYKSVVKRGRLLLFSYAFPPIQTQMTPVVTKAMAQLARNGYAVDVLCASPFSRYLGRDESLIPYVERHFRKVIRLRTPNSLLWRLRLRLRVLSTIPDLMSIMQHSAFEALMQMDLNQYEAIITWSPFHSINPVMVKVKKNRPSVRWLAQFSDPWAGNPLEKRKIIRIWSERHEPATIASADFIVHSSNYSRGLMMGGEAPEIRNRSAVCPHPFDETLFPQRPKARNERITIRHIGMLFERRTPEPLFQALNKLLKRCPDLKDKLHVELVGHVERNMLKTTAALSLPPGMITYIPHVSFLESLEKMYDADILLLIEADIKKNLFVPSKLSDYMGSRTPIVGLVPPGGSEDIINALGCWHARPADIEGIARALQGAVDYVTSGTEEPWCDEEYRKNFSGQRVAEFFVRIIEGLKSS